MKNSKTLLEFIFIITLSLFVINSCGCNRIQVNKVESIVFYAMPKGVERNAALISFQELKREGRDTLITDREFIKKFTHLVNTLAPDESRKTIDIRSAAVISMDSGDSLFVAFGENFGTVILNDNGKDKWDFYEDLGISLPSIYVNGDYMKDNPSLFCLIDQFVYGPHSNDYWFNNETQDIIQFARKQVQNKQYNAKR